MAVGTDTGGSIRIPSSLCGITGLKPTFGRVGRSGAISLAWGLDHVGPLARTVEDVACSFNAMVGYDSGDPGSLDEPQSDVISGLRNGIKDLKIGIPKNFYFDQVDREVEESVRAAYGVLSALGAKLIEVEIPMADQIGPVEFAILMPEASAYHQQMLRDTPELYTEEVRELLEAGEFIPATTYIQAQRIRGQIQREFRKLYERIDVLIGPTVTTTAVGAGQVSKLWDSGVSEPMISVYARLPSLGNVTGLPVLSVPCGFSKERLPIGMQIVGRPLDEATILRIGQSYQSATDWHIQHPAL